MYGHSVCLDWQAQLAKSGVLNCAQTKKPAVWYTSTPASGWFSLAALLWLQVLLLGWLLVFAEQKNYAIKQL